MHNQLRVLKIAPFAACLIADNRRTVRVILKRVNATFQIFRAHVPTERRRVNAFGFVTSLKQTQKRFQRRVIRGKHHDFTIRLSSQPFLVEIVHDFHQTAFDKIRLLIQGDIHFFVLQLRLTFPDGYEV